MGNPYLNQAPQIAQALGTGFIIRPDGLIITNNHVIEGAEAIKVQLELNSNKFYDAQVVGRDSRTDVALIKIDAKKSLPTAPLGASGALQVGEWVAAFGNPFGHAHTITKGIVSAIGREISEINRFPFIQTDASINQGNSGGPLVNVQGYVIGMNTAIDARAQGIGFAIPIDNVKSIVAQLEKTGRVKRGYIGTGLADLNEQAAVSLGLESGGGPAGQAGAQLNDIILEFGGKKTASSQDLSNAVADAEIGTRVKMKVLRIVGERKTEKTLDVTVADRPELDARAERGELPKRYFGQKAPFSLGFKTVDWSAQTAADFNLSPGGPQNPVIVDVEAGTPAGRAGLQPGDVILDVNRKPVRRATDVLKQLLNGTNMVRIVRGDLIAVVVMRSGR